MGGQNLYHLESRWRNSHALIDHSPLQIATFWELLAIYFHYLCRCKFQKTPCGWCIYVHEASLNPLQIFVGKIRPAPFIECLAMRILIPSSPTKSYVLFTIHLMGKAGHVPEYFWGTQREWITVTSPKFNIAPEK